ncbi:MAG TPA: heavy metal translocating P-type ATPase, partial [Gemmataceae bacterium]|nr:heavy metal translocating P-type ATPase [Gemmataceae bacterium]
MKLQILERSGPRHLMIAGLAGGAIGLHLLLRFVVDGSFSANASLLSQLPLYVALALGGTPLIIELIVKLFRREFGADLLAGISIVTSVWLEQYLAGTLVVLMLSGGQALEAFAIRRASSALQALAKRMPSVAHRKAGGQIADVALDAIAIGDLLAVFPHEICPADGVVIEGHGVMDESYLTGEPYMISKAPGSNVLSGAVNGEGALTIRTERRTVDSRYAKIMEVMRDSQQCRPQLRRLGDQLGAWYTPLALSIGVLAWIVSGQAVRFLAVLVIATPCPLLIAIPVSIIGSVSLAARRGIIIKDPAVLEKIATCRIAIFDKTGTLTYGQPQLTEALIGPNFTKDEVLALVASLERYSKHPLAKAILEAAQSGKAELLDASEVDEPPGAGLRGVVAGRKIQVTNRRKLAEQQSGLAATLPPSAGGLECVVLVDGRYAATLRFHDQPRPESAPFVRHLGGRHRFSRVLLVSGDREEEVRYLAAQVGIN